MQSPELRSQDVGQTGWVSDLMQHVLHRLQPHANGSWPGHARSMF